MVWLITPLTFVRGKFLKGPCKTLSPIVSKISDMPEMSKIEFVVLDIDQHPNAGIRPEFMVRGIPACFYVRSGKVLSSKIGMTTESDFIAWIKSNNS